MVFAMDMISVGQKTVGLFNHVSGEGLARRSADAGANKTANDTTRKGANTGPSSGSLASAFALANLDGRDKGALSMSYNRGKNRESERGKNRAQFWHGLASCGLRSRTILLLKAIATQL
jgi:hypothetical protein